MAKAIGNEAQSDFTSIKRPELFDMYVGEFEKGVREVFSKARENAPTVVIFDEIDAIAAERGCGVGDANVGEGVVSQLLTELDGLEDLEHVVVIARTNRPALIEDALPRPGRLDRHVAVTEPDEAARGEIFEIHVRARILAEAVDLAELAARTDGFVGPDIEVSCPEAARIAARAYVQATDESAISVDEIVVPMDHFEEALESVDSTIGGEGAQLTNLPEMA